MSVANFLSKFLFALRISAAAAALAALAYAGCRSSLYLPNTFCRLNKKLYVIHGAFLHAMPLAFCMVHTWFPDFSIGCERLATWLQHLAVGATTQSAAALDKLQHNWPVYSPVWD